MKKNLLTSIIFLLCFSGFSRSSKGKEFWLAFMENISPLTNGAPAFKVHVSSDVTTTCTLSIPYTGYTSTFVVVANQVKVFTLPPGNLHPLGDEATANTGIRIRANDSVEVKALHYRTFFSESSIVLPLHEIGSDYFVMAQQDALGNSPSEFVVLVTQNNTTIEIIPSVTTLGFRPTGVAFNVTLQAGQIYQLQAIGDLSGTSVRSLDQSKKIAVFGGARQSQFGCNFGAMVGSGADNHIYDQMFPIFSFGTKYHVVPFQGHLFDLVKVMASQNNTSVSVVGGNSYVLNQGQLATFTINSSCEISSNLPVAVAQLASSQDCNHIVPPTPPNQGTVTGDPGMICLVPVDLYLKKALFYTEGKPIANNNYITFAKHRLNIVIKNSAIGNLKLDNVAIPSNSFSPVTNNSVYSYARLTLDTLSLKQHTLTCDSGFNATIYGFATYNFYGHHLGYYRPELPDVPTSLYKNKINSSINIFPVPTSENLNVQSTSPIRSIQVINLFGTEVLKLSLAGSTSVNLDVGELAEGIYYCIVQCEDDYRSSEVLKFMKIQRN